MTSLTKFILLGLAFVSLCHAFGTVCPAADLSVPSSGVVEYECKDRQTKEWIKPKFTLGATAAGTPKATKQSITASPYNEYTFALSPVLSFSEVVTCPEVVTNSMTCDELKLYIGKTFDSTAGSPVKIGSEGAAGLSQFKCTEGAAIVYYLFFITFTDDATASTDTDIMASVASINAIIAEPTASNEVADSENLKPAVFQKFEAVDENTMTYVVQTSLTESYKIFKSDATTVTLTKKDFEAAFGDKVIADPDAAKACGDAVQLVFKEQSGSSSISAATMLLFAPFMLSMFK